jgi:uncharacterized membrane protein (UPF0182 family)
MTGFLAVDSNAGDEAGKVREGYGKLRLLELPRDDTVPGPGQAQNNFLTDSTVSRSLNLLRQGGTTVTMGNLLTLPVGGGLLYVQPVYISASSGTQYPLMQYVLTAFGDSNTIGFASTLEESLNQTFGGDSGAEAGDSGVQKDDDVISGDDSATTEPTDEATPSASASATPSASASATPSSTASGTAQERLDAALSDMQDAVDKANTAMKNGDWTAYGEAQESIDEALQEAIAARNEIEGK